MSARCRRRGWVTPAAIVDVPNARSSASRQVRRGGATATGGSAAGVSTPGTGLARTGSGEVPQDGWSGCDDANGGRKTVFVFRR